ncbi:MAG: sulfurtransferase [Candidatus Fluviicola riflensis]|nr:MAG: sulfurtransferase [Candidatus Fluviicola riflensis]OGS79683.1 MAG: sulfurtransferase [Candidatus Fluviicola riflensis]OGS87114.1 MAG: sulfurtransferase [Fluviicola sp. RIFCSPHIGHO2_01_FULL_43_53]OGS89903.1 MAG: sulfurtransferase [Fluviicola sp. RIFCSPHIGHO2_12_FULL_43_24]
MKTTLITTGILLLFYLAYRTFRIATTDHGIEKLIANGAVILDVRTETEFDRGHIKGSVNISLGTIRERYTELDKKKTYITCCSHGLRSVKVESLLKERGFRHVYNGGAWSDLEPLVKRYSKKRIVN